MPKNTIGDQPKHYPALDGLRGLAVLMVLLHHYMQGYSSNGTLYEFLKHFTLFMWSGVDLFFVLSGFLITGILVDAKGGAHYFRSFYARRVLRIFPLYYAAVFFLFVFMPLIGRDVIAAKSIYYWTYLTNLDVALHGWPNPIVGHFWSLAIEEQFYLVWPLIIYLVPTKFLRRALPILAFAPMLLRLILTLTGTDMLALHVGTLTHCDGLIMGSAIAVYLRTKSQRFQVSNRTSVASALVIGALFIVGSFGYLPFSFTLADWSVAQRTIFFTLISLAFAWLLYLCVGKRNGVQQIFSQRWLQWLGRYSYGLYVLHRPIIWAVAAFKLPSGVLAMSAAHPFVLDAIYLPIYFVLSLVAAYASYHLYEQHFLRLKKYFRYDTRHRNTPKNEEANRVIRPAFESSYN